MRRSSKFRSVSGLMLAGILSGCDTVHAFVYNMTECPIRMKVSLGTYESDEFVIAPGDHYYVFGGLHSRYEQLSIRDEAGNGHYYAPSDLVALRPPDAWDDRWAYYPNGLRFLKADLDKADIANVMAMTCVPTASAPLSRP